MVEAAGGGSDRVFAAAQLSRSRPARTSRCCRPSTISAPPRINLIGNELSQYLYGNAGANRLDGGGGADVLTGFGGADRFAFTSALGGGNVDRIADFSAVDDTIWLDDAVFAGLAGRGAQRRTPS